MGHPSKLVALAALLWCFNAGAAYSNLAPPPGWSAGGGVGGSYSASAAAAAGQAIANARASANFTGRVVSVPVAFKYGAGAARVATRALMGSPLGLGVAGAAWLASKCIKRTNGQWMLGCGEEPDEPPEEDRLWWANYGTETTSGLSTTKEGACRAAYARIDAANPLYRSTFLGTAGSAANGYVCKRMVHRVSDGELNSASDSYPSVDTRAPAPCPSGYRRTGAGCVPNQGPRPITPEEAEEIMAPVPMPEAVPREIPGTPLPVEMPTINPRPGTDSPAPLHIPTGDPRKVPNSNPERWEQPEIVVTPAPSPNNPFRVDVNPVSRPVANPNTDPTAPPQRDPYTPPVVNPNPNPSDPANPDPDPADPKPEEKTPDLCEKYPDILACQVVKAGELEADPIKNTEIPLELKKEDGFPSGGQCPQAKTVPLMGKVFTFSLSPLCDFASMIKPLLIGFAWLAAAMTFLGVARRE